LDKKAISAKRKPMDPPLTPPVRIQPNSSTSITAKSAQKRFESFLEDFQARTSAASQGGNAAVTVQLQKLAVALKDERKLQRKEKGR
jgi:hypothetical protein